MTTKIKTHTTGVEFHLFSFPINKHLNLGMAVLSLFILGSCSRVYYIPNTQNIPSFKEKNEFRFMTAVSQGEQTGAIEVQTAYSITDKFALMGDFMLASNGDENSRYGEAAFGYFSSVDDNFVFETYGGLGMAKQNHNYITLQSSSTSNYSKQYNYGTTEVKYIKAFVQPSLGVSLNAFDFIVSSRIGYLTYYTIDNPYKIPELQKINNNKNVALFEPALTIRLGWKQVKLQAQGVMVFHDAGSYMPMEESTISIGLYFSFAERFLPKKESK